MAELKFLDYLRQKAGPFVEAAGTALRDFGARQASEAQRDFLHYKKLAETRQAGHQREQALNRASSQRAAAENPLGANQGFAQRNALLSAILPWLKPQQSTPGDAGVTKAMREARPAPGPMFDGKLVEAKFGPQATLGSIAQRAQGTLTLDPRAGVPNLPGLFISPQVWAVMSELQRSLAVQEALREQGRRERDQAFTKGPF